MKKARQICKCKICRRLTTKNQKSFAKKLRNRSERRFFKNLLRRDWDSIPTRRVNKKLFIHDYII